MNKKIRKKAEYKSSIRSRKMIRKAYMELLEEKSIDKITVTDIIKKADLNRTTFYAHYPDIIGVREEIENEIIDKMLEILTHFKYTNFFDNPTPLLLEVSRFLESNKEFYTLLIKANGSEKFLKRLKNIFSMHMLSDSDIPESLKNTKMVHLRICYFAGGIVNMYQEWLAGNLDCSLNDIALEVSKLLMLESNELKKIASN